MSDPITAAITAELLGARQALGMTRDELAAATRSAGAPESFTTAALRNVETGRRSPTVDELVWLSAGLRVPVRQLLGEHADLFGVEQEQLSKSGPIESSARRAIQELPDLDGHQLTLAEAAFALARALDGDAGMAAAAVGRELRATLKDIWDGVDDDDDDDEDELGAS